ncbi:F-box protein cpr30-like [Thalictrum thalictroides]|uniref:F-box protein cpr30-like n=1 Tax=Thalictrum thalictroides TaxID=46969 RepID=A0A7J6WVY2_THATH|nr:F-box protein cpr30-like [Thalictrum thalictroides]
MPQCEEEVNKELDLDSDFVLMEDPHPNSSSIHTDIRFFDGFGFDVKNNDYKVVRVLQTYEFVLQTYECNQINTQAEVYSLSTDSWKTIDAANLPVWSVRHGLNINAPFRNCIFCWLGITRHTTKASSSYVEMGIPTIFVFDFSKEVFETMSLPDVCSKLADFSRLRLASLKDNIACIESEDLLPWENGIYIIWVLNEYGVKESWTKLYTVRLEPYTHPIGVLNNGWIICEECDDESSSAMAKLSLCGPVTQETNNLPIQGKFVFNVAVYKESLVSFKKCKSCD